MLTKMDKFAVVTKLINMTSEDLKDLAIELRMEDEATANELKFQLEVAERDAEFFVEKLNLVA